MVYYFFNLKNFLRCSQLLIVIMSFNLIDRGYESKPLSRCYHCKSYTNDICWQEFNCYSYLDSAKKNCDRRLHLVPLQSVLGNLTVPKRKIREQLCLIVEDKLGVDAVHIPLEDMEVDSLSYHPFLTKLKFTLNHNNVTYQKLLKLFVPLIIRFSQ